MNRPPADTPLYRSEALASLGPRQEGAVVLMPGAGSRWVAVCAWLLLLALLGLLFFGHYTRRSTVSGVLLPAAGLIRLTSPQGGVVVESRVREGQQVRQGDVLFVLSDDRAGPDAPSYQRDMAARVAARRSSLEADLHRLELQERVEAEQLQRRIGSLRDEHEKAQRQLAQQESRSQGAAEATRRYQSLFTQGYVSRDELLSREAVQAELQGQVEALRRELLNLERQQGEARRELDSLKTRNAIQRGELDRAAQQAAQEYTELEARRRVVVAAPADGQVTLVRAQVGQSMVPQRPLAHLVPGSTELVARLYAPSRAAGFVREGMPVLMRYDAFPYQKYGQQAGRVLSVSGAAATPAELDEAAVKAEWATEPLFALTVSLPAQALADSGMRLPLQAGMRVEADVLHESRPLIEWVLEPLYAARARLRNE